jgi:hypothetical protein
VICLEARDWIKQKHSLQLETDKKIPCNSNIPEGHTSWSPNTEL